jgi:HSP20 family protein
VLGIASIALSSFLSRSPLSGAARILHSLEGCAPKTAISTSAARRTNPKRGRTTMANIRRPEGPHPPSALDPYRTFFSDPMRAMRELLGSDPFAMLSGTAGPGEAPFVPDIEIRETKDAFLLQADLPGVKQDDVEIDLTGNRLTISGRREQEQERREGERFYAYERTFGSFHRSVTLPEGVDPDRIQAELKDGVLRVEIPKRPETKAKRISVAGASKVAGSAQPSEKSEKQAEPKAEKQAADRRPS